MDLLKKREKPTENIAFIAILSAITVVFFAILNFVPFAFIMICLLFPFLSFVVGKVCRKSYFILYFFSSVLLSCTFAFYDLSNLLFYLIPSLLSGFLMAIFTERKISIYYQILLASGINFIFMLISVPFIELIYEINIISDIIKIFGLENAKSIDSFIYSTIFLFNMIQSIISYIFIIIVSPKLGIKLQYKDEKKYFYGGFAAIFGILTFIFAFFKILPRINFLLFLLEIYFIVVMLIHFNYKSKIEIFALAISFVLSVIFYVLFYNYIPSPNQICSFGVLGLFYGSYYSIREGIFTK